MKKLVFGLIATVMLSVSSFAQTTSRAASGCSADCFFNDCVVKCPSGTIPKCKCIVGSFSSCSCAEMIGKVSIKNEENIKDIIAFLEKNKLDNFKVLFNNIFNSLKIGDNESFKINFDKLEVLSQNEAENSLIIEKFVFSLKK